MKKILILLAATLALCSGCEKECGCAPPPDSGDFEYFIFGTAYGECVGDCAKIFQLEGGKLFADDVVEHLTSENVTFQTTSLSAEKVAIAAELSQQFPAALLDEANGQIGCPDCRDQGQMFVKVKTASGEVRFWFIDPDEAKYAAFTKAIREAVEKM